MAILSQVGVRGTSRRRSRRGLALFALLFAVSQQAAADTLRLDAPGLFARAVTEDVRLADDGKAEIATVSTAMTRFGIDPSKPNPLVS